jgi:tRNA(fMet)-specific endonuclease VapC
LNYFLDSDICVYCLNGKFPSLTKKLLSRPLGDIKIPSVVAAELFYGAKKSAKYLQNAAKLRTFLKPLEIIPFDEKTAEHYGDIRASLELAGKLIGGNDMMIAAIVLSRGGVLVTNNTREFSRVENLSVENWAG